jgi:hypothetical protein
MAGNSSHQKHTVDNRIGIFVKARIRSKLVNDFSSAASIVPATIALSLRAGGG